MGLSIQTNGTASFDSNGTWTLTKPSGVQNGDVMLVAISWDAAGTITPGTGWTSIGINVGNATMKTSCYFRIAQAGDTSWTWTNSGANALGGVCMTLTGNDQATQPDAAGTTSTNTGSATLSVNATNVITDQAYWVIAVGAWNGGHASDATFTAIDNGATANSPVGFLYKGPVSAVSTGTTTVTESGASTGQIIAAIPFAIRPASSSVPNWQSLAELPDFSFPPIQMIAY